jgi:hypothetical protein
MFACNQLHAVVHSNVMLTSGGGVETYISSNGTQMRIIVNSGAMTWQAARDTCLGLGSDLAAITSAEVASAIVAQVQGQMAGSAFQGVWIGGERPQGAWKWADGSVWAYTSWAPNQPDNYNGVEGCCQLITPEQSAPLAWKWNDMPCGSTLPFVCAVPGELSRRLPWHQKGC